jgi:hypothetical protein
MVTIATFKSRVIVLTGVAAVMAAGVAALRTDLLLSRGFDQALESPRPGLSFEATATNAIQQGVTVGDEGFWLTRAEVESPAPFAKALAVGDRITIAGADGRERRLEVMALKAIGGDAARTARALPMRLLLVTCRVPGEAGERTDAPVRFIIEAEPASPSLPAPAKSL